MTKKWTLLLTAAATLSLVACSKPDQSTTTSAKQEQTSSSSTASSQSSAASNSSRQVEDSKLDGTYKGKDEVDDITLIISGNEGTWTETDFDGEQSTETVRLDTQTGTIYIDGEAHYYTLEGKTLTIEEDDIERDDIGTTVLTKED